MLRANPIPRELRFRSLLLMTTPDPLDGARLLRSIDELASGIHALAQVLEERRTEIMTEVRGQIAETCFCTSCEATITGLANALRAHWSCLLDDEGNERGNFAGHCGSCTEAVEDVPETIACASCDADSPESLAAALKEGWTRLQRDEGAGWNFLGVCPTCKIEQDATNQPTKPETKTPGTLFPLDQ